MAKLEDQTELLAYLIEALKATKDLQQLASKRNKTTKIKAIVSMLKLTEARLDGCVKYAKAGGYVDFPLTMQKQLYSPIIEWLAKEVAS